MDKKFKGDWVYLKLRPYRQIIMAERRNLKLLTEVLWAISHPLPCRQGYIPPGSTLGISNSPHLPCFILKAEIGSSYLSNNAGTSSYFRMSTYSRA